MAAVFEDDAIVKMMLSYKGCRIGTWLWNLFLDDERECIYIKILDAVYEDMESLTNLDDCNTIRCGKQCKEL